MAERDDRCVAYKVISSYRAANDNGEPDATFALTREDDEGNDDPILVIRATRKYLPATMGWEQGWGYKLEVELSEFGPINLTGIPRGTFFGVQQGVLNLMHGFLHTKWFHAQTSWYQESKPSEFF